MTLLFLARDGWMDGWMDGEGTVVGRRSGKGKGGEGSIGARSVFFERVGRCDE